MQSLRRCLNPPVGGFLIRLLTDECNWVYSPPLVGNPPFGVAEKKKIDHITNDTSPVS